ncbi:MAG: zinc-ribbon domain-containing protein [Methanoregula sp.]|nr:MAG: zinc-ribbon domain-containing protein [Methanoregula sp.]
MKCPHCGIEVRDTTVICGYCGGKIPQRTAKSPAAPQTRADLAGSIGPKGGAKKQLPGGEDEGEDEEEGGLSAYLQPGEQVLIGSLNISVKKFFFHAYLTDRRIFLIDTQEKKLKVTAKDITLDTISGSIVEFSEASDPVLVLSIRSADDEIKTMKLVFAQNGVDRSSEIDEWITLLNEQTQPKKHKKPAARSIPEPEPEEEEVEPADKHVPARVTKPAPVRQELHPAKKPVKDYERQPPVKRLLSMYQSPKEVPKEVEPEEPAPRRPETRAVEQPVRRASHQPVAYREIPPTTPPVAQPVKKVEVHSAMKSAMKTAMQPPRQPLAQPVKRTVPELQKKVRPEPEHLPAPEPKEEPAVQEEIVQEDEAESPVFCQNCGKKLPAAANFCPGCGSKLGYHKPVHEAKPSHEKKSRKTEDDHDEEKPERPPAKHPAKKAPKGSEMTILHKFLRR